MSTGKMSFPPTPLPGHDYYAPPWQSFRPPPPPGYGYYTAPQQSWPPAQHPGTSYETQNGWHPPPGPIYWHTPGYAPHIPPPAFHPYYAPVPIQAPYTPMPQPPSAQMLPAQMPPANPGQATASTAPTTGTVEHLKAMSFGELRILNGKINGEVVEDRRGRTFDARVVKFAYEIRYDPNKDKAKLLPEEGLAAIRPVHQKAQAHRETEACRSTEERGRIKKRQRRKMKMRKRFEADSSRRSPIVARGDALMKYETDGEDDVKIKVELASDATTIHGQTQDQCPQQADERAKRGEDEGTAGN